MKVIEIVAIVLDVLFTMGAVWILKQDIKYNGTKCYHIKKDNYGN